MKKMGYNWNEKECTRFLEQGKALPKAKFQRNYRLDIGL